MNNQQKDDLQTKADDTQAETDQKAVITNDKDTEDTKIIELSEALARAMADMQNFKRRNKEDKASFVKFANVELLKTLIPVFDNFDRSANHMPDNLTENEWAKGIVHIHDDLEKTLERLGVKKMDTIGEKLDPNKHEALMTGEGKKDTIIEEFESGYIFQDETIKVAKVKVGNGMPNKLNSK